MKFIIVDATKEEIRKVDCGTLHEAEVLAGLVPNEVDHGSIVRGIGYVVAEFGLFTPVNEQHYFAIEGRLTAGNAVFYGYDFLGKTIDLEKIPDVVFLYGRAVIERAFEKGLCTRPQMSADGDVFWRWPEPMPETIPLG